MRHAVAAAPHWDSLPLEALLATDHCPRDLGSIAGAPWKLEAAVQHGDTESKNFAEEVVDGIPLCT